VIRNQDFEAIKCTDSYRTEIIYDEEEFSIQRNLSYLRMSIVFAILMVVSALNNTILLTNDSSFGLFFYSQVILVLLMMNYLTYTLVLFFKFRSKNNNVYKYEEVDRVEVKNVGRNIKLLFSFRNNTNDEVKLLSNRKNKAHIDFLKSRNVAVVLA